MLFTGSVQRDVERSSFRFQHPGHKQYLMFTFFYFFFFFLFCDCFLFNHLYLFTCNNSFWFFTCCVLSHICLTVWCLVSNTVFLSFLLLLDLSKHFVNSFLKVLYKSKVKQINKRNIFHKEHPKLWKHADSTEAEGVDRSSGDSAESAARRV